MLELNLSKLGNPTVDIGYRIRLEGEADPAVPSIRFTTVSESAPEGAGQAILQLERQGELGAPSSVRVRSTGGSASPGDDFAPVDRIVEFPAGAGSAALSVELIDDATREGDETIELSLLDPTGATLGNRRQTILTIEDDDDLAAIGFEATATIATEGDGSAELLVERRGTADGAVSVTYQILALSAREGVDYEVAGGGVLTWDDGESGAQPIAVTLFDDLLVEDTELVRFELTGITGGRLAEPRVAALVVRDDDAPAGCVASERALCLRSGRFRVEVDWLVEERGDVGTGGADPDSEQTGFFWFFDPENTELIVKVLDGRALTGAYWLFYGALSDIEYWVVAADLETGTTRVYRNEPGSLRGVADVEAFPTGDSVLETSLSGSSPDLAPGSAWRRSLGGAPTGACVPGAETLCLVDGRFEVEVAWSSAANGTAGEGVVVPRSDQSGTFWFFDPENVELVVKVLDARAVNGRFWVFWGALSDVSYTIRITDTQTGAVREYVNPEGSIEGGADVEAF